MTQRLGRVAAALSLALAASGPAIAQSTIGGDQMLQTLTSAAAAAPPGLTGAIIQQAAIQHMKDNPGMPANRQPMGVRLDNLAQINVQIQFALNSAIIRPNPTRRSARSPMPCITRSSAPTSSW